MGDRIDIIVLSGLSGSIDRFRKFVKCSLERTLWCYLLLEEFLIECW